MMNPVPMEDANWRSEYGMNHKLMLPDELRWKGDKVDLRKKVVDKQLYIGKKRGQIIQNRSSTN